MEKQVKQSTENFIKDIRRKTRRIFSSEQKIMIVMEAQRGESSVAEICRKHSIAQSVFYKWNKEFFFPHESPSTGVSLPTRNVRRRSVR